MENFPRERFGFPKDKINQLDPRHRTPIQLAVCLNRLEAARVLAHSDADCGVVSKDGWNCKIVFDFEREFYE